MERITSEQREAIKKATTERLRAKLMQAGVNEDEAFALDRTQLMEAAAETLLKAEANAAAKAAAEEEGTGSMRALKERELWL